MNSKFKIALLLSTINEAEFPIRPPPGFLYISPLSLSPTLLSLSPLSPRAVPTLLCEV